MHGLREVARSRHLRRHDLRHLGPGGTDAARVPRRHGFLPRPDALRMDGGTEAIGGVHKWTIDVNWKIPSENFAGDHYHVPSTHALGGADGLSQPAEQQRLLHPDRQRPLHRSAKRGGAQQGTAVPTAYRRLHGRHAPASSSPSTASRPRPSCRSASARSSRTCRSSTPPGSAPFASGTRAASARSRCIRGASSTAPCRRS